MRHTVYSRVLHRAAEILGGPEALAAYLGVPPIRLQYWLEGTLSPPTEMFLRLVDLLAEKRVTGAAGEPEAPLAPGDIFEIRAGADKALCMHCDGSHFSAVAAGREIRESELECRGCGTKTTYEQAVRLAANPLQYPNATIVRANSGEGNAGDGSDPADKQ